MKEPVTTISSIGAGLASWAKAWPDSKDAPPNRNAPPHNNLRLNIDFLLMRTCVSECQRFRLVYVDVYLFTDQFIKLFDCRPPRLRRAQTAFIGLNLNGLGQIVAANKLD
jgi:hypothetical protein